ncbi:hypothetical protein KCU93_g2684, partial [Aureobasidium melanogenum]
MDPSVTLPKDRTKVIMEKPLQQHQPQQPSPLFVLPIELRLYIYGLVIGDATFDPDRHIQQPTLLYINRQVRLEAVPVFYGQTNFRFKLPRVMKAESTSSAQKWLKSIGEENFQMLRHVSFYTFAEVYPFNININLLVLPGAYQRTPTHADVS